MTGSTTSDPDLLASADFLRAPALSHARPGRVKEWHHFVVHRPGWRVLVNVSLSEEPAAGGASRFAPRITVMAHDDRWIGAVHRFDASELLVSADLRSTTVRGNRVAVGPDGYDVTLDLVEHDIVGRLRLVPAARPFVVTNQPVGDGRLSWLFVPRLRATGRLRIAGVEHEFDGASAYHDHNWGRFSWGDDFGWEWSSVLATDPDDPWSFVFSRVTDRRRLRSVHQGLFVWRGSEPVAMFRDAAITVSREGRVERPPDCTVPAPMNLVLGGTAADVPAVVRIEARLGDDRVHLEFRSRSFARIALPSEVDLDRVVTLTETSGDALAFGMVGGEAVDLDGVGVYEVLHG